MREREGERGRNERDERAFMGPPYGSRGGRDNEVHGKGARSLAAYLWHFVRSSAGVGQVR